MSERDVVLADERLIDDQDPGRVGAIAGAEAPTGDERNAHGHEVAIGDDGELAGFRRSCVHS